MIRVGVSMCVAAIAGCAAGAGGDVETSTTEQAVEDDCDEDGVCPKNSPVVATFPFHDLFQIPNQQMNRQRFMISHFLINGQVHQFSVRFGKISGQPLNGQPPVTGTNLRGAQLWLRKDSTRYVLRIKDVHYVRMWAKLNPLVTPPEIEAYEIDWAEVIGSVPTGQWKNVCTDAMLPPASDDLTFGPTPVPNNVTFVFDGERIDAFHKTIYDWDPRWFNLGCAGHTLMKMMLTGHVAAVAPLGYITSVDERQAIMKMFAADFCGDGYAFTVPGVRLKWRDHKGWMSFAPPIASLETPWTKDGAVCLDTPRTDANGTADSLAKWPNGVMGEIATRCPQILPPCAPPANPPPVYHLVSVNP